MDLIKILIDRKTDYIHIIADTCDQLTMEVLSFQGVSRNDIDEKNDRFKSYVSLLRRMKRI